MRSLTLALALLVGTIAPSVAAGAPHRASRVRTTGHRVPWGMGARQMAPVVRVNWCEERGNWYVRGDRFQGGLGWMPGLWTEVRHDMGRRFRGFPLRAYLATPREQGRAMHYFVRHFMGGQWPDTGVCRGY